MIQAATLRAPRLQPYALPGCNPTCSQVDFEAPADYVEPARPSPQSVSPLSTSPLSKSPLTTALAAPNIDDDSSDDEGAATCSFSGSGFRLDGKPIKVPKHSPSAGSSLLSQGPPVSVGVRLGGGQTLGGGRRASGGEPAVPAAAGQSTGGVAGRPADGIERLGLAANGPPKGEDYWASLSGGNKLR